MSDIRRCPQCRSPIPSGAPGGLCPKCLLAAGLESRSGLEVGAATQASPAADRGFIPPLPAELAARFPQLEMLELLGKGGMGAVYKARQRELDRLVAVKILPPEISRDPAFAERFTREARALARLNHPNIVAVYDFGQTKGAGAKDEGAEIRSQGSENSTDPSPLSPHLSLFYIVMEYVDGVNLRQAIQAGAMAPKDALAVVPQICAALQFAHDEGVVHRDIKPENILVDKRGRVKIADFGLAKIMASGDREVPGHVAQLTADHQVMGTLRYMAPEQLEGTHDVDHRADIYSLGVVFYELLTGELPLGRFAPPSKKVQIDVRLDEVVLRALAKEPELRWQHASDVRTRVEAIVGDAAIRLPAPTAGKSALGTRATESTVSVSLPLMLVVSIGLVLGMLCATAGIVLMVLAFTLAEPGAGNFWGFMGGAFGCLSGGIGSLAGSWNTYRQLRGETDWMQMTEWTAFDVVLGLYGVLGLALLALAPVLNAIGMLGQVDSPLARGTFYGGWILGGLIVFQTAILLLYRSVFVFGSRRDAAKRVDSKVTDKSMNEAHFSRTAILGAVWAPFFLGALAAVLFTSLQSYQAQGSLAPPPGPPAAVLVLVGVLGLVGLLAPFGTTILGMVAISQIRRSGGKLYGLPLAVADSLLFPLLLLDGVIFAAAALVTAILQVAAPKGSQGHMLLSLPELLTLLIALPTIAWVDFRIVRAVWRSASQDPSTAGVSSTKTL